MKIQDLTIFLEDFAPVRLQESYDNVGLLVGDNQAEISGVLVSLDVTEEVIDEAITKGCNVVVSHHPIIFKGLKKLTGKTYVEKCVIKAIKNNIALYAIHTNLDNLEGGVNFKIAEKLGLINTEILAKKNDLLQKLVVFVPKNHTADVQNALYKVGAGNIGHYSDCSFKISGTGSFKPKLSASPYIGQKGKYEEVEEDRLEVVFPSWSQKSIMEALRKSHPYEEIAYFVQNLNNQFQGAGSGAIGQLPHEMPIKEFLFHIKEKMNIRVIKYTHTNNQKIKTVAVCGGVGSFLLPQAMSAKADAFVTSDFKYHEFFDAQNQIMIADIGHFESEQFTKDLLVEIISKKFSNFATYLSDVDTNPIKYYF